MLNEPQLPASEVLDNLQSLQRDIDQIGWRSRLIAGFLNGALAALLAAGTYLLMLSWDAYEFWARSSAITVFVIAYMLVDRFLV